jgi:hypothetical protein
MLSGLHTLTQRAGAMQRGRQCCTAVDSVGCIIKQYSHAFLSLACTSELRDCCAASVTRLACLHRLGPVLQWRAVPRRYFLELPFAALVKNTEQVCTASAAPHVTSHCTDVLRPDLLSGW